MCILLLSEQGKHGVSVHFALCGDSKLYFLSVSLEIFQQQEIFQIRSFDDRGVRGYDLMVILTLLLNQNEHWNVF